MAKGNLGNLLQHFVAIHAADALVRNSPEGAKLVYVDCFSMAPWEEIEKRNGEFCQFGEPLRHNGEEWGYCC